MNRPRQLYVHGSVNARDTAGRTLEVQCDGFRVNLDASSPRAAFAALTALRRALASAGLSALSPTTTAFAINRLRHLQVDFRVRGRIIGLAGRGAHPNWLGRRLTQMPIEVRWAALMRALFAGP